MEMHFPMVYTEINRDEKIERMFPEMHASAVWDIQFDKDYVDHVLDYLVSMRVKLVTINIRDDDGVSLAANVNWKSFGREYRRFRDLEVETGVHVWLDLCTDDTVPKLSIIQLANIVRNMDVETTRYTYHVFTELLIWVHYSERALQKMYDLPMLPSQRSMSIWMK